MHVRKGERTWHARVVRKRVRRRSTRNGSTSTDPCSGRGGVIVKTADGYKFECAGRTMSLPHKDTMTKLKLAATRASEEIHRINKWNQAPALARA